MPDASSRRRTGSFSADDGCRLSYTLLGDGPRTVVLLHGLTANGFVNWEQPGIAAALAGAGWQVVVLDARGHGRSDKPLETSAYGWARHGRDVSELLDHLELRVCVLVGYSLGAGTAAWLAPREPRVGAAVLAGLGPAAIAPWPPEMVQQYVEALLAPHGVPESDEGVHQLVGAFDSSVAVSIANVRAMGADAGFALADIDVPVLVLNGLDDVPPGELAALVPGALARSVPGDHGTAPLSPQFAEEVVGFLRSRTSAPHSDPRISSGS